MSPAQRLRSRTARNRVAAAAIASSSERVAIYGRLSLFGDATTSPERQIEICEAHPRCIGGAYNPDTDRFEDFDSRSAYSDRRRPSYELLKASLDRYDVVLVYRLDRVARKIKELLTFLELCEQHHVALVSATEPIDTGSELGKMVILLAGIFAEMESNNIGERVASAQDFMTRNGRFRGGPAPFGYRGASTNEPGGYYFRHEPSEIKLLLRAIDDIFAGASINSIARWLSLEADRPRLRDARARWEQRRLAAQAEGIEFDEPEPERGRGWDSTTVGYILTNPILIGHGTFGEDTVTDEDGEPLLVTEPLLDEDVFELLCTKVRDRGKGAKGITRTRIVDDNGNRVSSTLFSGIALCDLCARPLGSKGNDYFCGGSHEAIPSCVGNTIKRAALDDYVLGWLEGQLTPEVWQRAIERLAREADPDAMRRIDEQRSELLAQLRRLREDRKAGLYEGKRDKAIYRSETLRIKAEIEEVEASAPAANELAALLQQHSSFETLLDSGLVDTRRFLAAAINLRIKKGQPGGSVEQRRARLIERVQLRLAGAFEAPGRARSRSRRKSA